MLNMCWCLFCVAIVLALAEGRRLNQEIATPQTVTVKFQVTFANKEKPDTPIVGVTSTSSNALDVLDSSNILVNRCYKFKHILGIYGPVVREVCQVPNEENPGKHWVVYLNDKAVDFSVACYQLKNTDFLRLNYETKKSTFHEFHYLKFQLSHSIKVKFQVTFANLEHPNTRIIEVSVNRTTVNGVDVLKAANQKDDDCYHSQWIPKKYGPDIILVCNTPRDRHLNKKWVLYVNNKLADHSVACYKFKSGDFIRLNYETTRKVPKTLKSLSTAAPKIIVKYQVTFANFEKPNTPIDDVNMELPRITAYDLLDKSNQLKDRCYRAQMIPRKYGPHVSMVCDVANDTPAGKYWVMYLNGVAANLNTACYKLKNGDFVRMNYETSKKEAQIFSYLNPQLIAPKTISVGLEIDFPLHEIPDPQRITIKLDAARTNGIDLLDKANSLANVCFHSQLSPERYGPYIDTVCDMSYNRGAGEFWYIYINGKLEDSSISCYQLKNGDIVRLTFQILKNHIK